MSIEIRETEGVWECDWGVLTNPQVIPASRLAPLMTVTPQVVNRLLESGPEPATPGPGVVSATNNGRLLFHHDGEGGRTTWELHEAHFQRYPGFAVLLGRWPD